MSYINSFSENMTQLTASVADAMAMLSGYNESAISSDSSTKVTLIDGSTIELPSYSNVIKRCVAVDIAPFKKVKIVTNPPTTL